MRIACLQRTVGNQARKKDDSKSWKCGGIWLGKVRQPNVHVPRLTREYQIRYLIRSTGPGSWGNEGLGGLDEMRHATEH